MTIETVFIVMLIGHIVGDFYLQTDQMVKERKVNYKAVMKHGVIYTCCMAVVLAIGIPISKDSIKLCVLSGVVHFGVDSLKYLFEKEKIKGCAWIKNYLFVIDQCVHFVLLFVCWDLLGKELDVRWFITAEMEHLPQLPITIGLGVLCILRPIGILIAESQLHNYRPDNDPKNMASYSKKNAGRMIGYLERLIVFIFLMYEQLGAIAFVLTAKSVARFKEIEKNQAMAEYYLIGTLMSVVSVMAIAVLLGVCS